MEESLEELQKCSTDILKRKLFIIIENEKKKYSFANIEEKKLNEIINSTIEELKGKTNILSFKKLFIEILENKINTYIINKVERLGPNEGLVKEFIDTEIVTPSRAKNILYELKKLSSFFKKFNFQPTFDFCIELLKIRKIKNLIKSLYESNKKEISQKNIGKIIDDDLLSDLIKCYCKINNITLEENDEKDNENSKTNINSKCNSTRNSDFYQSDNYKIYIMDVLKCPTLTPEQEKEIAKRCRQNDEEAKKILIESNLKLVIKYAKYFVEKDSALDLLDLIQEGNIGLIKAVEKFDPSKGYRFGTYATRWIKLFIQRAIFDKGRNVRLPVHLYEKYGKINKAKTDFIIKFGREPSISELSKMTELKEQTIIDTLKAQKENTISINTLIDDNQDTELKDLIPSDELSLEEQLNKDYLKDNIKELLSECNLSDRQIEILSLRFGLNGLDIKYLEEISELYNISPERIRQLESWAINKIRTSSKLNDFVDLMENPIRAQKIVNYYQGKKKIELMYNSKDIPKEIEDFINSQSQESTKEVSNKDFNTLENKRNVQVVSDPIDLDLPKKVKISDIPYQEVISLSSPFVKNSEPLSSKSKKKMEEKTIKQYVQTKKEPELSSEVKQEKQEEKTPQREVREPIKPHEQTQSEIANQNEESNINILTTKEGLKEMLEILTNPSFANLLEVMTPKEAIIFSLRLGTGGKRFKATDIAEFLEIDVQDVFDTTNKALNIFQENSDMLLEKEQEKLEELKLEKKHKK